jgi:hypothetical protein
VVGTVVVQAGDPAPALGSLLWVEPTGITTAELIDPTTANSPDLSMGSSWILALGRTEIPFDIPPGFESSPTLAVLESLIEPDTRIVTGNIRLSTPIEVISVPLGAVQANESGATCVWRPSGDGFVAVPVIAAAPGPGYVVVTGIDASDPVLANPSVILENPACP